MKFKYPKSTSSPATPASKLARARKMLSSLAPKATSILLILHIMTSMTTITIVANQPATNHLRSFLVTSQQDARHTAALAPPSSPKQQATSATNPTLAPTSTIATTSTTVTTTTDTSTVTTTTVASPTTLQAATIFAETPAEDSSAPQPQAAASIAAQAPLFQSTSLSVDDVVFGDESSQTQTNEFLMPQPQAFQQQHPSPQISQKLIMEAQSKCQLPATWKGRWAQSKDRDSIRVTNTDISDKGTCRDQKGDKYLFEYTSSSSSSLSCLLCLVINERHLNVLQYKESSCQPIPSNYLLPRNNTSSALAPLLIDDNHSLLNTICRDITGDAQLESLFRVDTPPIECPISGRYSFTYDNCNDKVSTMESCVDKKQLTFKYAQCQDPMSLQSQQHSPLRPTVMNQEVVKCYAEWAEGNTYYMIGRITSTATNSNSVATTNQDTGKFRCFIYEKSSDDKSIVMASSFEENFNMLIKADEGPRTMRLESKQVDSKCRFPEGITSLSSNWNSVDDSLIYTFNQNGNSFQVEEKSGAIREEAVCLEQIITDSYSQPSQKATYPRSSPVYQPHHTRITRNSNSMDSNNGYKQYLSQRLQQDLPQQPQVSSYDDRSYSRHPQQQISPHASQQYQSFGRKAPTDYQYSSFVRDNAELNNAAYINQHQDINNRNNDVALFSRFDVTYLVQMTIGCQTAKYCVKFYKRSPGIVQIDYVPANTVGCQGVKFENPSTQVLTLPNIQPVQCPLEGHFSVDAPVEFDLNYEPSNIFVCPKQSKLVAQCNSSPTKLTVESPCSAATTLVKNYHCLGNWESNGLHRFILTDDKKRQRYSIWYRINTLSPPSHHNVGGGYDNELLQSPTSLSYMAQQVDLQINLIRPQSETQSKPLVVKLRKTEHCRQTVSPVTQFHQRHSSSNSMLTPALYQQLGAIVSTNSSHELHPSLLLTTSLIIALLHSLVISSSLFQKKQPYTATAHLASAHT